VNTTSNKIRRLLKDMNLSRNVQPCPTCGSTLFRDTHALVSECYIPGYHVAGRPLPRRTRLCTVVACSACEFVQEVAR
jgi:hypothetical protein